LTTIKLIVIPLGLRTKRLAKERQQMIGIVGVGDMGLPMSRHMLAAGFDVIAYDVDHDRLADATAAGARPASGLAELAQHAEVVVACLRTDDQMEGVAEEMVTHGRPGQLIVVAGTHSLDFMQRLATIVKRRDMRLIDAPVVFGAAGAREGTLLSLCGGDAADVERARPVMEAYSRGVEHVGPLGAGQLAKTCNNLLHWIHCVANFEALAIAKRFGVDAQRMREEVSGRQRNSAPLGQHAIHVAGKGHGFRDGPGTEGRAGVAAVRTRGSTHQDVECSRCRCAAVRAGVHISRTPRRATGH
jgi:3-hydroxyisobutyrate dehydrogenase-like beta-hydroxyacid dehydrogenase